MTIDPPPLAAPPLFLAADVREIERRWAACHPGTPLMDAAGNAIAELAGALADESGAPILILAGPGNNGGDALAAARVLAGQGFRPTVVSRADPARMPADAARARVRWLDAGGTILEAIPAAQRFGLVIDGLFGIGLVREVGGWDAQWIDAVNALDCPRLAIDVPSGLDSDRGCVRGTAVRADHTLSFLGLKPGLFTADGPDHVGTIHFDPLGVDAAMRPATHGIALTRLADGHRLPPRRQNSHKGMFGHVAIVGGAVGMVGAALIAGRAALERGAGSVTLGILDARVAVDYGEPRLMIAPPERLLTQSVDVLAIGPGLGQDARAQRLVETALEAPTALVLDADALNLLAAQPALAALAARRRPPTLITPHPGEAGRLLGVAPSHVQDDRIESARALSAKYRAHVALKGAGTVVAHPDGRYAINTTGGPWLAHAGSGDRLTGIVAALLGQGLEAGASLEAGVWLHGQGAAPSHR